MFKGSMLKQEALLRKALREKGINDSLLDIKIDHMLGTNSISGIETGIIYPDSFYYKSQMLTVDKEYDFYFNGNMDDNGGRRKLLEPFTNLPKSKLVKSNFGRLWFFKSIYNKSYYKGLAKSKFGLCPHQLDWPGPKDNMWTYRFIECCFVGTLPVIFNATPLGSSFIEGFEYFTDDYLLNRSPEEEFDYNKIAINKKLAKKRFLLSEDLCDRLKKIIRG